MRRDRSPYSIFLLAFATVLIAACQDWRWEPKDTSDYEGDAYYYRPPVSDPSGPVAVNQREKNALQVILSQYPGTTDAAPIHKGTSPFGVMVGFPDPLTTTYCSASHLKNRKVILAAHCIRSFAQAQDYYFLFFDKQGKKRITRGMSILYKGLPDEKDIALVEVDERADDWDTLKGETSDSKTNRDSALGQHSLAATIWGFDPGHHNGVRMMSFRPRHCALFRTSPVLNGTTQEDIQVEVDYKDRYPTERFLFADECQLDPVDGNSGALVSMKENPKALHGIYKGSIAMKKNFRESFKSFEITGSSGKRKSVSEARSLFELITALDSIEKEIR